MIFSLVWWWQSLHSCSTWPLCSFWYRWPLYSSYQTPTFFWHLWPSSFLVWLISYWPQAQSVWMVSNPTLLFWCTVSHRVLCWDLSSLFSVLLRYQTIFIIIYSNMKVLQMTLNFINQHISLSKISYLSQEYKIAPQTSKHGWFITNYVPIMTKRNICSLYLKIFTTILLSLRLSSSIKSMFLFCNWSQPRCHSRPNLF